MPSRNRHSCHEGISADEWYPAGVTKDEARQAISQWIQSVLDATPGLTLYNWSERKGAPSYKTMSRALKGQGKFVTSNSTLIAMAEAIGVQPPNIGSVSQSIPLPSAQALEPAVQLVMSAVAPGRSLPERAIRTIAKVLRDTLEGYVDQPEAADDPKQTRLLAQFALKQFQAADRGKHAA